MKFKEYLEKAYQESKVKIISGDLEGQKGSIKKQAPSDDYEIVTIKGQDHYVDKNDIEYLEDKLEKYNELFGLGKTPAEKRKAEREKERNSRRKAQKKKQDAIYKAREKERNKKYKDREKIKSKVSASSGSLPLAIKNIQDKAKAWNYVKDVIVNERAKKINIIFHRQYMNEVEIDSAERDWKRSINRSPDTKGWILNYEFK